MIATNEVIELGFVDIYQVNKDNLKIENIWSMNDDLTLFLGIGFVKYDLSHGGEQEKVENNTPQFPKKPSELNKEWLQRVLKETNVIPTDVEIKEINTDANVGE